MLTKTFSTLTNHQMKAGFGILTCLLLLIPAYAISDISENIRQKNTQSIISELARNGLINSKYQIISIPDKGKTEFVNIFGSINDYGKSGSVLLTITRPDGFQDTIQTPVLETGRYSTYLSIDSSFSIGSYKVDAKFGQDILSTTYFHLGKNKTPLWLDVTIQWWKEHKISDSELVNALQFLIDEQILIISETKPSRLDVIVTGQELVRRGTTHTILTHVNDGINPIQGARVTLTIEDYGEDIIREFEGFTNQNGDFVFSWEIPKSFDDTETLLAYVSVTHGESARTTVFKFQVYCLPGESGCKIEGN